MQQAPNNKLLNLKGSRSEKSFPGLHPGRTTDCFKTRELQAWNPRLVSPNKALARWCPGDISALLKAEERPSASWALSMASWAAPDGKLSSSEFSLSYPLCLTFRYSESLTFSNKHREDKRNDLLIAFFFSLKIHSSENNALQT